MQNEDTAEHEVRLGKGFHSFTQLDNLIFTYYGRRMGVYGRLVYESLLYHANNTTHKCWPSHQTIAEEGGMSVRQVQRELANLVEMGFIQIISRIAEGKSNLYIVEALKDPFTEDGVTNSRTHKQTSEKPNRGGLIDMGGWTNSPTNYTNSTILINKFLSPKGDSVPPPPA
ncbi:helix-turn-helix domain-containing protein, partial [Candidatus Chlorohelix sp.]|uniref:helix-turn-helix domain-containing protein n=1 Tax=Candidatus Chlorohelix sp. TaxID=3139201 RepID=UPI00305FCE84